MQVEKFSKEPSFKEVGVKSPITGFALRLAAYHEGVWRPSGTAIIIGPHLAVTAKHVVEDFLSTYEPHSPAEISSIAFSIVAIQIAANGDGGSMWAVTKVFHSPFTDIAFLQLMPQSAGAAQYRWRGAKLQLLPPPVGSRVVGFGYHSSRITITSDNTSEINIECFDSPTTTVGEVMEVHKDKRDTGMLHFPCFRTNARLENGMSGARSSMRQVSCVALSALALSALRFPRWTKSTSRMVRVCGPPWV